MRIGERRKSVGILERCDGVVHRARADDHEQPVVVTAQDGINLTAATLDQCSAAVGERQFRRQLAWQRQRFDARDPQILGRRLLRR